MIETLGAIALIGALFGFSIAAVKACDPTPTNSYYIVWENVWLQRYSDIIEASNAASAWRKLRRKHWFDKPRCIISIEEI